MQGYYTVTHNKVEIIILDLTGGQPDEILQALRDAHHHISTLPPKSALVLSQVKDTAYNSILSNIVKDFTASNTPYIKASAVVGADGLRKVLLQTVISLTKREIKTFPTQEEALDWLASQA